MKTPQDSEEFIAQQKAILAENPECANSHYNMGVSLMEQEKFDEAISKNELISVRSLSSSFPTDPDAARLSYAESFSLVDFLLDEYGGEKMSELLGVFKAGSSYDDALIQVYGFDMDGLDARWRGSLGLSHELALGGGVAASP